MNALTDEQDRSHAVSPPTSMPSVSVVCVALYLAIVLILFFTIRHRNQGVFTYTLDDPYIHLALADSIAHGHYGINPGEPSSPSSSILWPLLLVPFAAHPWGVYAPLLWNILFGTLAAVLIGRTVDRWRGQDAWSLRLLTAVLLMLIANLPGLTFVGMEHGSQVLLAIACAAGLIEALNDRPIPTWCIAAAVLGPCVRYENFALVAALALALYGQRRYRSSIALLTLSLIGPVLFSVFLHAHGLPILPSSVLVKARTYTYASHGSNLLTVLATLTQSFLWGIRQYAWYTQILVFLLLAWLTRREKRPIARTALAGAALAALLQVLIGRYNWFFRYEVYALTFTTIVATAALVQTTRICASLLLSGLAIVAAPYALALYQTPAAASNVYQQQFQLHRFLATSPTSVVAVNDLGLVSYHRPPGLYVLDLWGLASPEASRQPFKDAAWLDDIAHAHHAGLVVIYPNWYPEGAPDDWLPLGTMCIAPRKPTSIAERCVVFYSTPDADHAILQRKLTDFARTLPPGVTMTLGVDSTDTDDPISTQQPR